MSARSKRIVEMVLNQHPEKTKTCSTASSLPPNSENSEENNLPLLTNPNNPQSSDLKLINLEVAGPSTLTKSIKNYSCSTSSSPVPVNYSERDDIFSSDDSVFDPNYEPVDNGSENENSENSQTKRENLESSGLNIAGPSTTNTVIPSDELQNQKPAKKWSVAVRKERKKLLNTGQSYINVSGKPVNARELKPLETCRKKCHLLLNEDVRKKIFKEYWQLGNHDKRVSFIASLVENVDKQTTRKRKPGSVKVRNFTYEYFFQINGKSVPVCKACFCSTLDEKEMFVRNTLQNKQKSTSGIINNDARGKSSSVNKKTAKEIEAVLTHIYSFPAYESHYTRKTNDKKYLPTHLNLTIMYKLYKETHPKPVSRMVYEREFHKTNLKFKKPSVDTCSKCDTLAMKIKVSNSEEEKCKSQEELKLHQERADLAYSVKKNDKTEAQANNKKKCFSFDLQQCLPTPLISSSVAFYKRQLWTFNLTIHDNSSGESTNYMWHEAIAGRGANEIASCLYIHLQNIDPIVEEVTFYSDTCQGQNKNSHVSAMFLKFMAESDHIKVINHKFLEPGHTHMECDVDHSMIEKQKKRLTTSVYHPHDSFQLVRGTGKKNQFKVIEMTQNNFLDFAALLTNTLVFRKKNINKEAFKIHDVNWLQYRANETGMLFYTDSLLNEEHKEKVSFLRRNTRVSMPVKQKYFDSVPISKEKKKDILDLLPLVPPIFHQFYQDLTTNDELTAEDPDLIEFEET